MAYVFRVEHKISGKGPYRDYQSLSKVMNLLADDFCHPCPEEEKGDISKCWKNTEMRESYYFGFQDLNQLFDWFNECYFKHFRRIQIGISVYSSEDVVYGEFQVIFLKKMARKLDFVKFTTEEEIRELLSQYK